MQDDKESALDCDITSDRNGCQSFYGENLITFSSEMTVMHPS